MYVNRHEFKNFILLDYNIKVLIKLYHLVKLRIQDLSSIYHQFLCKHVYIILIKNITIVLFLSLK